MLAALSDELGMAPKRVSLSECLARGVFPEVFSTSRPELINPGLHSAPFQATRLSPRLKELEGIVDVLRIGGSAHTGALKVSPVRNGLPSQAPS